MSLRSFAGKRRPSKSQARAVTLLAAADYRANRFDLLNCSRQSQLLSVIDVIAWPRRGTAEAMPSYAVNLLIVFAFLTCILLALRILGGSVPGGSVFLTG